MKGRVIALERISDDATRAALIVDGRLEDLLIDTTDAIQPRHGQIFAAIVDRPIANTPAAFARLPGGHMAYVRDARKVKSGDRIVVQITGYPDPGKAWPASVEYLLKSRIAILTPGRPGANVARSLKDPEVREHLQTLGTECLAEYDHAGGLILRTEAAGAADGEVEDAIRHLIEDDAAVLDNLAESKGPALLLNERADWLAERDWLTAETDVATHDSLGISPFEHFGVWDEIEKLKSPRADLPSGGWMAIEATRAMVTVDVNTGDQFNPSAGMTTNIEAVRELPRQLRLRGLGGQVIIDFAPLKKMHRRKIDETLKTAFRRDPIATTLAGWTPLGNFEMQRKRERRPLSECL